MKTLLLATAAMFAFLFSACSSLSDVTILDRTSWKAENPRPFKPQVPSRIVVHHEGTFFDTTKQSPTEHIHHIQTWGMGKDRNWSDVPYHFFIDLSGIIYEGRNVFTQGETNLNENVDGQLQIALLGNFDEQQPAPKQLHSLLSLLELSCRKYSIPADSIKTHKDYAVTQCPGKNLSRYFSDGSIRQEVKRLLQK